MKRSVHKGFTLLEVMVAMAVLSIALGAIIQNIGATTSNIAHLKAKTFAHWVAMNRAAELQAMQLYPSVGTQDGSEEMGGHEWFWRETVAEAPLAANGVSIDNVRRVDIEVRADRNDKNPLTSLMTFIGKPVVSK